MTSRNRTGVQRSPIGGPVYNVAVTEPRDEFPNHFVGD